MKILQFLKKTKFSFWIMVVVALVIMIALSVLPNLLLIHTVSLLGASFSKTLLFVGSLLLSAGSNTSTFSALMIWIMAILTGYYVAVFVTNRKVLLTKRMPAEGFVAFIVSLFGVGCAACGSLIVSSLVALTGSSAILAFLPFHGTEFLMLGILLLLYSLFNLLRRINQTTCPS